MLGRMGVKVANMASTFADRLQRALDYKGCSRADLARVLRSPKGTMGVSESAIGQLLDGKSKSMSAENCERAARYLGVDSYWLATGEGTMHPSHPVARLTAASPAPPYLTATEVLDHLGAVLSKVPSHMRAAFADSLQAWARSGGETGAEDRRAALLHMLTAPAPIQHSKRVSNG